MQIIDIVQDLGLVIDAARQVRDQRNTLERFLPNTRVQSISYRMGRAKRLDQTVPVRAFGSPAIPIRRPGIVDVKGDLPAITPIVNLTETDLNEEFVTAQRLAGLNVDYTPWVEQAAGMVAVTTDNTYELMRGQVLTTHQVSLVAEDGGAHAVDFNVPASQRVALATKWSDDPSKVFTSLDTAHQLFIDSSGDSAAVFLTTAKAYRTALRALQTLFPQQPVGQIALNAYLADQGLPPFVTYDRSLVVDNDDGSKSRTRIFPDGYGTFLPQGDVVGRTEIGVTQEALQQVHDQILTADQAAGLTILTLGQVNPVAQAVQGASVGLPVLQDKDSIVTLSNLV